VWSPLTFIPLGDRPLPSFLGGGDLDGDVYNLIPLSDLPEFTPKQFYQPAEYKAVEKKMLNRPSTMADVADFVMEYINSDVRNSLSLCSVNSQRTVTWCNRYQLAHYS
jgi:RNA-dependent RNA polymerase